MRTCLITNNDCLRDDVKSVFGSSFSDVKLSIANDAVIAHNVLKDSLVDLVLIDVDIDKNGLNMIDSIKRHDERVRIIVITENNDEFTMFMAKKKDIVDYITFPVDLSKLIGVLTEVFQKIKEEKGKILPKAFEHMPIRRILMRPFHEDDVVLDERISSVFISIGIAPNVSGYAYLREGIKIAIKNPLSINHITKVIYPRVAEAFASTPSKVERAMRHAISSAWNRGRVENLNQFLGIRIYSGEERPTNGEFIALIADKLLLEGA